MKRYIVYFFITVGSIILTNSCISTREYSVNQNEYLGEHTNSEDIYTSHKSNCFYSPLNINISPMDRLMLIDFKGDSIYETIELQVFDDARGKGALVILYVKNGDDDVYYTDSVFANQKVFKGHLFENKNINYSINVTDCGLDGYVSLKDKFGRSIEARINETKNDDAQTSFLAPVGGLIRTFTFFPLFYMENFDFVKRSGTEISIKIDNILYKPAKLPVLVNGTFVYLSRYALKPVICSFNDCSNGVIKPLLPVNGNTLTIGNVTYILNNNNGHFEINKISSVSSNSVATVTFSPSLPDLVNLIDGVKVTGKFSMEVDSITGIVAGTYQINRSGEKVIVLMNPQEAYSPMNGPLWVLLYEWRAELTINSNGSVNLFSQWNYLE